MRGKRRLQRSWRRFRLQRLLHCYCCCCRLGDSSPLHGALLAEKEIRTRTTHYYTHWQSWAYKFSAWLTFSFNAAACAHHKAQLKTASCCFFVLVCLFRTCFSWRMCAYVCVCGCVCVRALLTSSLITRLANVLKTLFSNSNQQLLYSLYTFTFNVSFFKYLKPFKMSF